MLACVPGSAWIPLWSVISQALSFQHRPTSLLSIVQAASLSMTSWQKITCDHFGVHAGSSLTENLSLITTWGYLPPLCWNHSVTEALMAGTQEYSRFPSRWVKETIEGLCRLFNGPSFKDIIEAFVRALDLEASPSQKTLSGSFSLRFARRQPLIQCSHIFLSQKNSSELHVQRFAQLFLFWVKFKLPSALSTEVQQNHNCAPSSRFQTQPYFEKATITSLAYADHSSSLD